MLINSNHKYLAIMCTCCGKHFDVPVYCGDRFCDICSYSRHGRVRKRLGWLISRYVPTKGSFLKHLTLTIPNQENLPKMLRSLLKAFRSLRQTAYWRNHVKGGAFVIEITGKTGSWHGHLHIVLDSTYMKWSVLRDLWIKYSGGRGVWINAIPPSQALSYLTKYLSKPEVSDQDLSEVNASLKGFRLFQPFGTWFAVNQTYVNPPAQCSSCSSESSFITYREVQGFGLFWHWGTNISDT